MKKYIRYALLASLMVTVLGSAVGQAAPKWTLKLAHAVPVENAYHYAAIRMKERVEKETNGEVMIEIFPNNQLSTGERDILEGLQLGTIDLYMGSTGPMSGFEKRFLIFDSPYLFKDKQQVYQVLDGPIGQKILRLLDVQGIHCLAWMENGFRNLTNSRRPINSVADVATLKIRTQENKVHIALWRALSVDPTPMAWSEVFTSLQQGTIDGQENPIPVIYTSRLFEVQKYLALTRHVFSSALIAISENVYQSLPEDYQKIVENAAQDAALHEREVSDQMERDFVIALEKNGMVVTTPDMAPFQEAVKNVYADFRGDLGDAAPLLDEILSME